jgi:hypothetical protein
MIGDAQGSEAKEKRGRRGGNLLGIKEEGQTKSVPIIAYNMKRLLQFHCDTESAPIHTKANEFWEYF